MRKEQREKDTGVIRTRQIATRDAIACAPTLVGHVKPSENTKPRWCLRTAGASCRNSPAWSYTKPTRSIPHNTDPHAHFYRGPAKLLSP